jgi:hypothetical protein
MTSKGEERRRNSRRARGPAQAAARAAGKLGAEKIAVWADPPVWLSGDGFHAAGVVEARFLAGEFSAATAGFARLWHAAVPGMRAFLCSRFLPALYFRGVGFASMTVLFDLHTLALPLTSGRPLCQLTCDRLWFSGAATAELVAKIWGKMVAARLRIVMGTAAVMHLPLPDKSSHSHAATHIDVRFATARDPCATPASACRSTPFAERLTTAIWPEFSSHCVPSDSMGWHGQAFAPGRIRTEQLDESAAEQFDDAAAKPLADAGAEGASGQGPLRWRGRDGVLCGDRWEELLTRVRDRPRDQRTRQQAFMLAVWLEQLRPHMDPTLFSECVGNLCRRRAARVREAKQRETPFPADQVLHLAEGVLSGFWQYGVGERIYALFYRLLIGSVADGRPHPELLYCLTDAEEDIPALRALSASLLARLSGPPAPTPPARAGARASAAAETAATPMGRPPAPSAAAETAATATGGPPAPSAAWPAPAIPAPSGGVARGDEGAGYPALLVVETGARRAGEDANGDGDTKGSGAGRAFVRAGSSVAGSWGGGFALPALAGPWFTTAKRAMDFRQREGQAWITRFEIQRHAPRRMKPSAHIVASHGRTPTDLQKGLRRHLQSVDAAAQADLCRRLAEPIDTFVPADLVGPAPWIHSRHSYTDRRGRVLVGPFATSGAASKSIWEGPRKLRASPAGEDFARIARELYRNRKLHEWGVPAPTLRLLRFAGPAPSTAPLTADGAAGKPEGAGPQSPEGAAAQSPVGAAAAQSPEGAAAAQWPGGASGGWLPGFMAALHSLDFPVGDHCWLAYSYDGLSSGARDTASVETLAPAVVWALVEDSEFARHPMTLHLLQHLVARAALGVAERPFHHIMLAPPPLAPSSSGDLGCARASSGPETRHPVPDPARVGALSNANPRMRAAILAGRTGHRQGASSASSALELRREQERRDALLAARLAREEEEGLPGLSDDDDGAPAPPAATGPSRATAPLSATGASRGTAVEGQSTPVSLALLRLRTWQSYRASMTHIVAIAQTRYARAPASAAAAAGSSAPAGDARGRRGVSSQTGGARGPRGASPFWDALGARLAQAVRARAASGGPRSPPLGKERAGAGPGGGEADPLRVAEGGDETASFSLVRDEDARKADALAVLFGRSHGPPPGDKPAVDAPSAAWRFVSRLHSLPLGEARALAAALRPFLERLRRDSPELPHLAHLMSCLTPLFPSIF